MLNNRTIMIAGAVSAVFLAGLLYLLLGIPGLLLGAIIGVFAGMMLAEKLSALLPQNRRRIRRMMRHEGLR